MSALNSFAYDFTLRVRLGGLNLNYFVVAETPTPMLSAEGIRQLSEIGMRLGLPHKGFADHWLPYRSDRRSWHRLLALTPHERARIKAINEALCAFHFGLRWEDLVTILEDCDLPQSDLSGATLKNLNPKGFWRIDKDLPPELRHPILSLAAFRDLKERGIEEFMSQNDGEGWSLPESIRLSDLGLGRDQRAQEFQPVRAVMGEQLLDWQVDVDPLQSWQECAAHAALIRQIVPDARLDKSNDGEGLGSGETPSVTYRQGGLF